MILLIKLLLKECYQLITAKRFWQFARLVLLYGSKKRYTPISVKTGNYRLSICDNLSFIWQYKEIFVEEYYRFQSNSAKPLIYDCGSNIGLSCLYFKSLYPDAQIKAFEADPEIAALLKNNMVNNNIQNAEVVNAAVWISDEIIGFNREGADAGSAAFSNNKNQIQVQGIRLRSLLEKEKKIDMLKMDIEGAETNVIEDCQDHLNKIDHIFIEYHSQSNAPQALDRILGILSTNKFRYYIETANRIKNPLLKSAQAQVFQTNIFAVKA